MRTMSNCSKSPWLLTSTWSLVFSGERVFTSTSFPAIVPSEPGEWVAWRRSHPGPTADLHRRSLASLAELPVLVHPADVDAGVRTGRVLAHVLLRSLALPWCSASEMAATAATTETRMPWSLVRAGARPPDHVVERFIGTAHWSCCVPHPLRSCERRGRRRPLPPARTRARPSMRASGRRHPTPGPR